MPNAFDAKSHGASDCTVDLPASRNAEPKCSGTVVFKTFLGFCSFYSARVSEPDASVTQVARDPCRQNPRKAIDDLD
jgi:hypothetical protein